MPNQQKYGQLINFPVETVCERHNKDYSQMQFVKLY